MYLSKEINYSLNRISIVLFSCPVNGQGLSLIFAQLESDCDPWLSLGSYIIGKWPLLSWKIYY